MSGRLELFKLNDGFLPADEVARRLLARLDDGEVLPFKSIRVRDLKSHRRYWKLMELCAHTCEQIQLPGGGLMEIRCKEDMHTAVKLCTGHCTRIFDADGNLAFVIPSPTNFDDMEADEWDRYLPKAHEVIREKVLPGVPDSVVETEILKLMGWAR